MGRSTRRRLAPGPIPSIPTVVEHGALRAAVRNVGKRDRDERVAEVNHTSGGIGWTGADRLAVFGSNVEAELGLSGSGLGRLVLVKVVGLD